MKFDQRIPIYLQVIQLIEERITTGIYSPGEILPSRRDMARDLKINPNTVQRAFKEMEEKGLIVTDNRKQSAVTEDIHFLKSLKKKYLCQLIQETLKKMQEMKLSKDEVIEMINEMWPSEDGEIQ